MTTESVSSSISFSPNSRDSISSQNIEECLKRPVCTKLKPKAGYKKLDGLKKIRRMAANARERCRMHTVNYAFDKLRMLVPCYPSDRKLSKIATLKLATMYIADLDALLHDTNNTSLVNGDDIKLEAIRNQTHNRYCIQTDISPMQEMQLPFLNDGKESPSLLNEILSSNCLNEEMNYFSYKELVDSPTNSWLPYHHSHLNLHQQQDIYDNKLKCKNEQYCNYTIMK